MDSLCVIPLHMTTPLQHSQTSLPPFNNKHGCMQCAGWRWHVVRLPVPSGESRIRLYRIPGISGDTFPSSFSSETVLDHSTNKTFIADKILGRISGSIFNKYDTQVLRGKLISRCPCNLPLMMSPPDDSFLMTTLSKLLEVDNSLPIINFYLRSVVYMIIRSRQLNLPHERHYRIYCPTDDIAF